ncbi:J domain-containing protein [Halorussus litoreus]|uniref:J domain-containing protein n=1 Tax=Halorussus litoreus TaxID=1710536 RepID=UPI001E64B8A0|nr:J domain-containing protein [Halorussus litoreus]
MNQERLMFGLAAVLAGIATLEFVLAFVYTPALFAVAVPFAAAAYLVWYHASGRLRDRVEEGRAGAYGRPGSGPNQRTGPQAESQRGGFGAGPRESYSGRRGGFGTQQGGFGSGGGGRAGARGRASATGRAGARGVGDDGPTPREAYRALDLDPGADDEAVRQAYRERVKSVHPDREDGDEEEFKRVTEAYELLRNRN